MSNNTRMPATAQVIPFGERQQSQAPVASGDRCVIAHAASSLGDEYLTRSEIAAILKISAKQAGRLMDQMPALMIGTTHRRILRSDFDAWRLGKREVGTCQETDQEPSRARPRNRKTAISARGRATGITKSPLTVFAKAEALERTIQTTRPRS
jgi:hypothetical protein